MISNVTAKTLRSKEFDHLFKSKESVDYFSKPSMLIRQTDLDRALSAVELSRKHVPYEKTSLFRSLAESLYSSQHLWSSKVKNEFLSYLKKLESTILEQSMDTDTAGVVGRLISLVESIEEKGDTDTGPSYEDIMDLLPFIADCYGVGLAIFREDKPTAKPLEIFPTGHPGQESKSFEGKLIRLAINACGHVDIVLTFEQVATRAMVQGKLFNLKKFLKVTKLSTAAVYDSLYTNVFKYSSKEVERTVVDMLREKKYAKLRVDRKRHARDCARKGLPFDDLPDELAVLPPISYKDAKSLDLSLYRNVTMDVWLQSNKERFVALKIAELQPGDKCIVTIGASRGQNGRKSLGTILSKSEDNTFQVERSDGLISFVTIGDLELVSKRKERQATFTSSTYGNSHRSTSASIGGRSPDPSLVSEPLTTFSEVSSPTFSYMPPTPSVSSHGHWTYPNELFSYYPTNWLQPPPFYSPPAHSPPVQHQQPFNQHKFYYQPFNCFPPAALPYQMAYYPFYY